MLNLSWGQITGEIFIFFFLNFARFNLSKRNHCDKLKKTAAFIRSKDNLYIRNNYHILRSRLYHFIKKQTIFSNGKFFAASTKSNL